MVGGDIGQGYSHDARQRLVLCQSGAHELMVDVPLVGFERRAAVPYPDDEHAHYVEHRHEQQRERHDEVEIMFYDYVGIVHGVFHAEHAENEAQRQAAGVAHEYLAVLRRVAEEVEIQKGRKHAYHSGY